MSGKTLFRPKNPVKLIQTLIRDSFRKLRALQEKQCAVRAISFSGSDQSFSPQFSAAIGLLLKCCPARVMHFSVSLDRDAIKVPMDGWLLWSLTLVLTCCINRRTMPVTNGIKPASRLTGKPGHSADLSRAIVPTPYALGELRVVADAWRMIAPRKIASCSIIMPYRRNSGLLLAGRCRLE
jgi:hypothetical protein